MRLLDLTDAEEGHADLSKGTIVEDLVINNLHANDLADVSFLEQVFSLNHVIVEGQMVDLQQHSLDTHPGLANALHKLYDLIDLRARVLHEVDALELSSSGSLALLLDSLLDLGVG